MGTTRIDLFTAEQNNLASFAKAIAHPARISILQILKDSEACINSDLVKEIGLSQPTISQHLKALKETGIIKGEIEGTRMNYCIDVYRWNEIKESLQHFFTSLESFDTDCC